jgi:integrase
MARTGDGLYLRGKTWWFDAYIDGKRYRFPVGKNIKRTVAAEIATTKRGEILKGNAGILKKKKDIAFEDASRIFLEWVKTHRGARTYCDYKSCLEQLKAEFGGKMLSQISPFSIEAYKVYRVRDGAKVRPNRELAVLRNLYNKVIKFKKYEGENVAEEFDRLPETRGRDRILDYAEEQALIAAAPEPVRSIIILGLQTGLRVFREGLTLTWDSVNLVGQTLTVEAAFAKNHEKREIELNSIAMEVLKRLKTTVPGPYVFMTKGKRNDGPWRQLKSFKSAFDRACQRANLSGVTPHTLRHTWASRMEMSGASQKTLMELGGWKDPKMVARYSHTSKQHRREAIERIVNCVPTNFPISKTAEAVSPYAPVAQVDRATVS